MAKKYGEKTIERLRSSGYSDRAIEDVTYLADVAQTTIRKVEQLLSEGYNPSEIQEIYSVARKWKQNPRDVQKFYDSFRDNFLGLDKLIGQVDWQRSEDGDLKLHQAIKYIPRIAPKYNGDFNEVLLAFVEDYQSAEGSMKRDRLDENRPPRIDGLDQVCLGEEPIALGEIMEKEFKHLWGFD